MSNAASHGLSFEHEPPGECLDVQQQQYRTDHSSAKRPGPPKPPPPGAMQMLVDKIVEKISPLYQKKEKPGKTADAVKAALQRQIVSTQKRVDTNNSSIEQLHQQIRILAKRRGNEAKKKKGLKILAGRVATYEQVTTSLENQIEMYRRVIITIEQHENALAVKSVMSDANEYLNTHTHEVTDVHNVVDNMNDHAANMQELNDGFSVAITPVVPLDDDDLDAILSGILEEEDAESELRPTSMTTSIGSATTSDAFSLMSTPVSLPSVPTNTPSSAASPEMNRLLADMGLA